MMAYQELLSRGERGGRGELPEWGDGFRNEPECLTTAARRCHRWHAAVVPKSSFGLVSRCACHSPSAEREGVVHPPHRLLDVGILLVRLRQPNHRQQSRHDAEALAKCGVD